MPGPVPKALVDAVSGAGECHEPVLLHRLRPVDDLLGTFDLCGQRVLVALVAFPRVVVDQPPLPGVLARAHRLRGFERFTVAEHDC